MSATDRAPEDNRGHSWSSILKLGTQPPLSGRFGGRTLGVTGWAYQINNPWGAFEDTVGTPIWSPQVNRGGPVVAVYLANPLLFIRLTAKV